MRHRIKLAAAFVIFLSPLMVHSQDTSAIKKDTTVPKVDTIKVVVDTVVKKDCYTEYYDIFRTKGAKAIPDGMQQVVIAMKGPEGCHCFLGQIEVVGGKMKAPLFFQQDDGQYRPVTTIGKKLEPAFVASMTVDELYSIKDGMSIVFRTADQEYGRLFFYKFVNKGAAANKLAPSPTELMKE
jgi:hypothetical protein